MKLQYKFFLTFFLTAFIPLVIITSIFYNNYQNTILKQMDSYSSNVFHNATNEANKILDRVSQAASQFSFYTSRSSEYSIVDSLSIFSDPNAKYTSYDIYKATRNLDYINQNVLYSDTFIYGIYIFTPSGVILSSTTNSNGDIVVNYKPQNEAWYTKVKTMDNKEIYVSQVSRHNMFTGKKPSLFFAKKLNSVYEHKDLGILLIDCNPKMFNFNSVTAYSDITKFTIQNNYTNTLIYSDNNEEAALLGKGSKSMSSPLKFPSLTFTSTVNYTKLADKLNLTGIIVLSVALICAVGILIVSYILSRGLTKPIASLSQIMAAQNHHNLNLSDAYMSRNDEVGMLYNEYNNMIDKLNTSIKHEYQNKLIILDAQMKSLEAQINSHFLFNTLESINSMAEIEGCETISTMALSLGNMFRYAIKTQSELVTIGEELNQVNDYIAIQMIRYEGRFQCEITIPPEIKRLKVLKLILQPIVENSLKHGILSNNITGLIRIDACLLDNCIYIKIIDNGCGITDSQLEILQKSLNEEATFTELGHNTSPHIGLKNIHSRIELYYGIGYGLTINSDMKEGTTVTIKLPIIERGC